MEFCFWYLYLWLPLFSVLLFSLARAYFIRARVSLTSVATVTTAVIANPKLVPVHVLKEKISDGFYLIGLRPMDVPKLGIVFHQKEWSRS